MKVTIAGAGEVGYHLAKLLASEANDITIIDENEDVLSYIAEHLDVQTIQGDAKSISILTNAGVGQSDILLSVTSNEETNLLVCIIGKRLGVKRTIARVDSREMMHENRQGMFRDIGVDTLISPSILASEEITRLIRNSAFSDEYEFEEGKLIALGIPICENSKLIDKSVRDSASLNPNKEFKPIALHRENETMMINAESVLKRDDTVYFISSPESLNTITKLCGKEEFLIKDIMILGGSDIGILTAMALEKDYNVIIIEKNKSKCEEMASYLKKSLIVNLDGSDIEALIEEGLDDMDAFIAVTGDSESNIMAGLMAKNRGVKKTIARIENFNYIQLSQNIGIDSLINKKIIAATNIFKFVRKGEVSAIAAMHGIDVELIEYKVKAGSKVTKKPIKELNFPRTASVAGVIRDDRGFIPFGDFQMQAEDQVVVFVLNDTVNQVEEFFL